LLFRCVCALWRIFLGGGRRRVRCGGQAKPDGWDQRWRWIGEEQISEAVEWRRRRWKGGEIREAGERG
jgi:hypothetical protein